MTNGFTLERERHERLAKEGQKPKIMAIACCDSRAAPENIFDSNPGEIFVLRNIGNVVPPFMKDGGYHSTSAAIEYAVQALNVQHIVVLGHGLCGGIQALLEEKEPLSSGDFVGKWMENMRPIAQEIIKDKTLSPEQKQRALEYKSIKRSLQNLRTFPFIKKDEENNKIFLHGAWFCIATGELFVLDQEQDDFYPIQTKPEK